MKEMQAVYGSFTREEFDAICKQFLEAEELLTLKKLRAIAVERGNVQLLWEDIQEARKNAVYSSFEPHDMTRRLLYLTGSRDPTFGG